MLEFIWLKKIQMEYNRKKYQRRYNKEIKISNDTELDLSNFPDKCISYGYEILDKNYEYIEDFIYCLNKWANIPDVIVYSYCKPRPGNEDNNEVYAEYHPSSQGKPAEIEVWLLTHSEKLVGPEEMLRTVMEEWMHHWDMKELKLQTSHHCKGFYRRIKQIMELFEIRV